MLILETYQRYQATYVSHMKTSLTGFTFQRKSLHISNVMKKDILLNIVKLTRIKIRKSQLKIQLFQLNSQIIINISEQPTELYRFSCDAASDSERATYETD